MKVIAITILVWVMLLSFTFNISLAQQNDAGLWLSANFEKKINKNFKAMLTQEFRFIHNYSTLGTYFTDLGLQYKISKSFNATLHYRYTQKLQSNLIYQPRNRFYLDISYRYKAKKWTFGIRSRFQDQVRRVSFDERYSQPTFYWRNKFTVKRSLKDFTPYASVEIFNPLSNPNGIHIDQIRYSLGSEYELNKKNSIDGYFMIDKEVNINNPLSSYNIGISYNFSF